MNLSWIKNFLLLISSILITMLISEILLRVFYNDLITSNSNKILYYSKGAFKNLDNEAVSYMPNQTIRSVAIYDNQIEYDTLSITNNLGFRDFKNYEMEQKRGIIVLGDSFTSGSGNQEPWLSELDIKYTDINFYNFGVPGTGHSNFLKIYEKYQSALNHDTVIVLSITDDFFRQSWYPIETSEGIIFCTKTREDCLKMKPIIYTFDGKKAPIKESFMDETVNKLYVVKLIKIITKDTPIKINYNSKNPYTNIDFPYDTIVKLQNEVEKSEKRFIFIHIPEKREAISGKLFSDFSDEFDKFDIEYYSMLDYCSFDKSMYYNLDSHPNKNGYKTITNCLEKIILQNNIID